MDGRESVVSAATASVQKAKARNRDVTRAALLDAACDSFCARGYEATSLRDIARAVGVNHALIKYYFSDKESIWREAVSAILGQMTDRISAQLASAPAADARSQFQNAVRAFVEFWSGNRNQARLIFWACIEDNDRMRWLSDTFLKRYHDLVASRIRSWREAGVIIDADPTYSVYAGLALSFVPLVFGNEIAYSHGRDVFSASETARLYDLIFASLGR